MNQKTLKELLFYDPETGFFTWLARRGCRGKAGAIAGCIRFDGYRLIGINRRVYSAHRLAWLYMTGEWPENQVDHVNLKKDDNSWSNLREATCAENSQNCPRRSHNSSGVKGVSWDPRRKKWRAQIRANNRVVHLGRFADIGAAAAAYAKASKRYHGEFARRE